MKSLLIAVVGALGLTALASPGGSEAVPTGSITGSVSMEPPPPPRRTSRARSYSAGSEVIQQLPAVVYLRGTLGAGGASDHAVMVQRDTAFTPGVVAVTVGGTVEFPNDDPFFHNVFSYSEAKRLDLGRYPQGESKEEVFDEVGVVEVFCEVHEEMRGAVIVTENPFHAVVDEDGSFTIADVPAGEHTVIFWSADHDSIERTVTVPEGGTVEIEVELTR